MDLIDVGRKIFQFQQTNKCLDPQIAMMKGVAHNTIQQLLQAVQEAETMPKTVNRNKTSFEQSLWTFSGFWRSADTETKRYLLHESFNQLSQIDGPRWCGIEDWKVVNFRAIVPELDPQNHVGFNSALVSKAAYNPTHEDLTKSDSKFNRSLLIRLSLKHKGISNDGVEQCLNALRLFTRNFIILGVIELMVCIRDDFLAKKKAANSLTQTPFRDTAHPIPQQHIFVHPEHDKSTTREDIEQLNALGNKYYRESCFQKAHDAYDRALKGWRELGLKQAMPDFEQQLALLHLNCATSLLKLENYEMVLQHIPFALSHRNTHLKALYRRGQAYEGMGSISKAAADYKHVLYLRPSLREAEAALARVISQLPQP